MEVFGIIIPVGGAMAYGLFLVIRALVLGVNRAVASRPRRSAGSISVHPPVPPKKLKL
jgi:hypothetical protein